MFRPNPVPAVSVDEAHARLNDPGAAPPLLVDVREPYEQFLSQTPALLGIRMTAVPLSRLLNELAPWLARPQPLLFFCRTGNRSRQAAQALARLGHPQAFTLAGGLALMPARVAAHDPALYV